MAYGFNTTGLFCIYLVFDSEVTGSELPVKQIPTIGDYSGFVGLTTDSRFLAAKHTGIVQLKFSHN